MRLPDLEAGQEKAQSEADALYWKLDEANTYLRRTKQELKESQDTLASFKDLSHRLNDEANQLRQTVSKNEQRIHALAVEKGNFSSQLKSLRNERKGKGGDEPSIDVFDHRVDQVSEARIKSGVESLNDSLDNFVMELLEAGERLVVKNADLVQQSPERLHDDTALLRSLAQPNLTSENRGLLLDAQLHDRLHQELYELFFSGEVASKRTDRHGVIEAIFNELTQREPWTVVQRWRAITASSLFTLFNEAEFSSSIREFADSIVALLAWAHGLSPQQFEAMTDMINSRLRALYKEANDLSILVRRDILSVRMSIISMTTPIFDPATANSIWPEMGAAAGDEVVGRIKFGLIKLKEAGGIFCLLKPEVATTALIRETSKNG
ncbi:hypothetical protein B0H11DRAFT_1722398 [Mycena galericulata]|nr:hypothetical protein B0H11DRAFT_1728198 [Mycena galericulata]KAJ7485161.1 hypothetical protein B0H11DRAFT_1722398 [Mycena galericulata]